ncbi:hypothetical protein N7470_001111 [Penicillium chermesinum]|nr:hypothetical protein N7470_001111 [Penicillium chermesinum]
MSVFGIVMHHGVFIKNEWHMQGPNIIKAGLASYILLMLLEARRHSTLTAMGDAVLMLGSFAFTLLLSPRLAGVSKLWHMYQNRYGQNHLVLERMHREYGDFVRTGPNEITIFHPHGLPVLDGPGSQTSKSDWYDFLLPNYGVTTIRNRKHHDQRRRLWLKGFSTGAMANYQTNIEAHARKLDAIIADHVKQGEPVPLSTYIYWFSFDIMGIFAFSRSFNMLSEEHWHYAITNLRKAMRLLGPMSCVPWVAQVGFWLLKGFWVVKDWETMIAWCAARMRDRIQLALHPEKAEKLYEEIRHVDIKDLATLKKLPYLNAVITETLRLHPAVPTGGNRDTPPEGMVIAGQYIPGNTTVICPRYTLGRLTDGALVESCFARPTEWIPERWDTEPELVKDTRANLPFAQGRYTCLGKDVAMNEMLVLITLLVSKYRFDFVEGKTKAIGEVEGKMRDQFTATPGTLDLVFTKREQTA